MVDSVVSFLLDNISQLLIEEVKLLSGVEDKVTKLSNELKFIDIFLKSSKGKRNDPIVKEVVSQIRDVAYEVEDVVDTYVANVTMHRKRRNIFSKLFHSKSHVMMLHDVNAQIESIKSKIDEIYKNKERYGIGEGEFTIEEAKESIRKRREKVEEEDVVGLEHDSDIVIKHLMEKDSYDLNVVSIVGMGGLGKTTLARKIYNNNHVSGSFPCRAWGYVSNDYRAKELLLSLLKCLMSSTSECQDLSEEELKEKVREHLSRKKYLVVLDDIWKTETWDELKDAFPNDHQSGSRILITSRIKEVASHAEATFVYDLPFLNEIDSWKLFTKKAFPREVIPFGLEDLSKVIFKGCAGLPLAIIVLAGIVAKKDKSQREMWLRSIKDHVNWQLSTQDNNKVEDILKLSYDSLPQRLKPCFLYLGIYPEDYEIPVRQLIQLWVAEGFIQPPKQSAIRNAPEPEQVAEDFLDELVDRSLVQVARRRSDGGVKTCRIHDLLRDLCLMESQYDKFLEVCTESNIETLSKRNPRRLSLHCWPQNYLSSSTSKKSSTRSFFFFAEGEQDSDDILSNMKLVRVLTGPLHISKPYDWKMMIHLKYLRIDSRIKIFAVFPTLYNLWNLQTLDVLYSDFAWVPSGFWKLKRLRHLYIRKPRFLSSLDYESPTVDQIREDNKTMWNLQTLCVVALDQNMLSLVKNGSFPNLRKLGMARALVGEHIPSLHYLKNLHTLKINCSAYGTKDRILDPNMLPLNLIKITLIDLNTDYEIMATFGRLPKLQIFKVQRGLATDMFNCVADEFPQLQVFHMENVQVKKWGLEKGAMPRLRHLVIKSCMKLSELPEELWSLATLQEVHVVRPSHPLAKHLQNIEVKNDCKITV